MITKWKSTWVEVGYGPYTTQDYSVGQMGLVFVARQEGKVERVAVLLLPLDETYDPADCVILTYPLPGQKERTDRWLNGGGNSSGWVYRFG